MSFLPRAGERRERRLLLLLISMLLIIPSVFNLGNKLHAFLTWDSVVARFSHYDERRPYFEGVYKDSLQQFAGSPSFSYYQFEKGEEVNLLVRGPEEFYLNNVFSLVLAPFIGLAVGICFLFAYFTASFSRTKDSGSGPGPAHDFSVVLGVFGILSLIYSRITTITFFVLSYFRPEDYPDSAAQLPLVYLLEFFLTHSGFMMVVIPDLLKGMGRKAYHLSFLGLTLLYLVFVVAIQISADSRIISIYIGVILSRVWMHFEENPKSRGNAMAISAQGAVLFLVTVLAAIFLPIPDYMSAEMTNSIMTKNRLGSAATPSRLLFAGIIYFTLLFWSEWKLFLRLRFRGEQVTNV